MLFEIARSLRSLTRSPINSALHEARRMARPHFHFEEGGVVPADDQNNENNFMLPSDLDVAELASAIEDRLRAKQYSALKSNNAAVPSLIRTVDGKMVVPAAVLLQLGDGTVDRGRRVLEKIVNEIRQRRVLDRLPALNHRR